MSGAFDSRRWLLIGAVVAGALAVQSAPLVAEPADTTASVGEQIAVRMDQAKVIKLPEKTATLVVGNPLIADATVQAGGIIVVTPKSYGTTNIAAFDRHGVKLMEHLVQVLGPVDHVVVLYRGTDKESYSCIPVCERRIMLGDTPTSFLALMAQSTALNAQAQAQASK